MKYVQNDPHEFAFDKASSPLTSMLIFAGAAHHALVTLRADGQVEYGPGYTPDGAAHVFWQALAEHNPLRSTVSAFRILADGCVWHPAYRGHEVPRKNCSDCASIWKAREWLNQS